MPNDKDAEWTKEEYLAHLRRQHDAHIKEAAESQGVDEEIIRRPTPPRSRLYRVAVGFIAMALYFSRDSWLPFVKEILAGLAQ